VNAYTEPERLGVDRWLAMQGAWRRRGAGFLLVDAGTAVTLDLVDDRGRHQGGAILPGAELMVSSLVGRAEGIRPRPGDNGSTFPARNTGAAVSAGATLGLGGAVREAMVVARASGVTGPVIVTGGDSETLVEAARLEENEYERIDTLVFEGMLEML
jgi:type III pantothenate kinase